MTPILGKLIAVFPIVQICDLDGDTELTLISLDAYEHGSMLRGRLSWTPRPIGRDWTRPHEWPDLVFRARDDRGQDYEILQYSGSGSDGGLVFERVVTPALVPGSRELSLELTEVRWTEWWPDAPGGRSVREVTPGPWQFTIRLINTG